MPVPKDTLWKSIIETLIDDFIRYFFPAFADDIDFERGFNNSEIRAKFEQDLMVITKATQPMGFEEAIQAEFKKQGIEQGIEIGEAKRDEELLKNAVPELMQEGFSAERIATILNLQLEDVKAAIDEFLNREIPDQASVQNKNKE